MAANDVIRNALKPGQRVLWYEIESTLGQGGFGITYLARDTNLDQQVALKEYLPTELSVRENGDEVHPVSTAQEDSFRWGLEKFMLEARTLAHFDHRNIVKVYTVFEANNTAYMVMRYEDGMSLGDIYSQRRRLRERLLQHLVHPLLDGLESIHNAGFIHRDIKPDNIYLRQDASPVLLDFGSARLSVGSETRAMTSLVTPGYAPFEQYVTGSDRQGPWSDIYSFGATLYRGIAGLAPQDATNRSEALSYTGKDVLVPAVEIGHGRYSESFLLAVDAALRFRYDERPQSVAEWRRMFKAKKRSRRRRSRSTEDAPAAPVSAADYSGEHELAAVPATALPEPPPAEEVFTGEDADVEPAVPADAEPAPDGRGRLALALGFIAALALLAWLLWLSPRATPPNERTDSDSALPPPAVSEPAAPAAVTAPGPAPSNSTPDPAAVPAPVPDPVLEPEAGSAAAAATGGHTDPAPAQTAAEPPLEPAVDALPAAAPELDADTEFAPLALEPAPDAAVPPAAAPQSTNSCTPVASMPFVPPVRERNGPTYAERQYPVRTVRLVGPDNAAFAPLRDRLAADVSNLHERLSVPLGDTGGLSLAAMQALAAHVNRELKKAGLLATAMVPMQFVDQGLLNLLVLEWQVGEARLSGVPARHRPANLQLLNDAIAPVRAASLSSRELKRSLLSLLLHDDFFGSAFALLQPGLEIMHTDLVLQWQNTKPNIDPTVDPDKLYIYSISGDGALLPVSQLTATNAALGFHEEAVERYRSLVVDRLQPPTGAASAPWHCVAAVLLERYRDNWRALSAKNSIARDFKHLAR